MTIDPLAGARIRRVDRSADELLVLTLAKKGAREALVVRLAGSPRGIGLVAERPAGPSSRSEMDATKNALENALVERVGASDDGSMAILELRRGDARIRAIVRTSARSGSLTVSGPDDAELARIEVGEPIEGVAAALGLDDADLEALRARGPELVEAARDGELALRRVALDRALRRAIAKLDRRLEAIAADEARAGETPALRSEAGLVLASLHAYVPRAASLTVVDYEVDPPVERSIAIDPTKGARAHADELYRKAKRLERGAVLAAGRRGTTLAERGRLEDLRARAQTATEAEPLEALAEEAGSLGVPGARDAAGSPTGRRAKKAEGRVPYRRFLDGKGRPILVGRSAADNDALTFEVARPHDLWLHARAEHGAHVIVPLERGRSCPAELLVDAAMLAAHFSDARGETVVEVQHAERRHLRKPRGAAKGAVRVDRERVIAVRVERARLERLLAAERH